MDRLVYALAALATLLLVGCAAHRQEGEVVTVESPGPSENGKVEVGKPYFPFSAGTLHGGRLDTAELLVRGPVLLQFWGVRCKPCIAEMEFLGSLQERYGDRGLQVLGVNTDRADPAELAGAMQARALTPPYPVLLDPDFAISGKYTHWLIPVTVLVDRTGVVRAVHTGYKPELDATIESEVEQALEP